jgi:Domain of unknown function (DUF5655)
MTRRSATTARSLWTCPKCNRQFVNLNMPHSCGQYTVDAFLAGKSSHAIRLYEQFTALISECGPVLIAPAKTRIGFQVRMIFAAVNKLSDQGLDAHVVLTRRLKSARFKRVEMMTPKCFVHHFRLQSLQHMDEEVKAWLREAYHVGAQAHLNHP